MQRRNRSQGTAGHGGWGGGARGAQGAGRLATRSALGDPAGLFLVLLGHGARCPASWPPGEGSLGNAPRKEADMCPAVPEGRSLLTRPPHTIKMRLAQAHHTTPIFRNFFYF